MLVVFTETWQRQVKVHKKYLNGNAVKATIAQNKFLKYPPVDVFVSVFFARIWVCGDHERLSLQQALAIIKKSFSN